MNKSETEHTNDGAPMSRAEALKTLSLFAVGIALPGCTIEKREETPTKQKDEISLPHGGSPVRPTPTFFTKHEYATVTRLANMTIPADERSGNAEEAGVPEFIDFMMRDQPQKQTPMKGGLNWIDYQCLERFDAVFVDCTADQQHKMLEAIAWPESAEPGMQPGVEFFNRFRDLVATGFWTSRIGIADLKYMGNKFAPGWDGCPPEACKRLGVSYDS